MFYLDKKKVVKNTFIALCLFGVPQKSMAIDKTYLPTEQDFFTDFSVTSATRLAQSPRDLPVSVTIITREMIEASSATEIPDLIRLVPGFRVSMLDGGFYNVFGHGSANEFARKLEVLVDGLPVQSPVVNFVDWLAIPVELSDVEYIEVMRGTSTAVYGSNAFDGVINIVTRKPFEDEGSKVLVSYGDPDYKKLQYSYNFLSDNGSHKLTVVEKSNTGFGGRNDNSQNVKFRYNANLNPSVKDEVDILFSLNTGYKGDEDNKNRIRQRDMDSNTQYVKWKHQTDENDFITVKLYHYYLKYDDSYSLGLISGLYNIAPSRVPIFFGGRQDQEILYGRFAAKSNRYGLDVQKTLQYNDLRFVVGGALIYDETTSAYLFGDNGGVMGVNRQLFSNLEWRIQDALVLNTGLLAEKIENHNVNYSKRLSLNYHYNNKNTFRIGMAESYRSRSVYSAGLRLVARYETDSAIFGTVLDNQGYSTPEKITTIDIAHLVKIPNSNFSFDWRIFKDRYDDYRVVVNDPDYPEDARTGAAVSLNGGAYSVKGIELQFNYKYGDSWLLTGQLTKTKSEGLIANNLNSTTFLDYSDAMPETSYGFMFSKRLYKKINLGLTYTMLDNSNWRTTDAEVPAYKRFDINLSNEFRIGKTDIRFEIIGQNLLDDYSEYRNSYIFDKRFIFRFSLIY